MPANDPFLRKIVTKMIMTRKAVFPTIRTKKSRPGISGKISLGLKGRAAAIGPCKPRPTTFGGNVFGGNVLGEQGWFCREDFCETDFGPYAPNSASVLRKFVLVSDRCTVIQNFSTVKNET